MFGRVIHVRSKKFTTQLPVRVLEHTNVERQALQVFRTSDYTLFVVWYEWRGIDLTSKCLNSCFTNDAKCSRVLRSLTREVFDASNRKISCALVCSKQGIKKSTKWNGCNINISEKLCTTCKSFLIRTDISQDRLRNSYHPIVSILGFVSLNLLVCPWRISQMFFKFNNTSTPRSLLCRTLPFM
jgi:hypothetical protein